MPRIQVIEQYRGAPSGEQPILPGIYEAGDPALHGLETYLVENQRKAYWLDAPGMNVLPNVGDLEPPKIDLDNLRLEIIERGLVEKVVPTGENGQPTLDDLLKVVRDADAEAAKTPDYEAMDMDALRKLVELRPHVKVTPTGKNGSTKKADLVIALTEADAAAKP